MALKIALFFCALLAFSNALPWTYSKLSHVGHAGHAEAGRHIEAGRHRGSAKTQDNQRARIAAPSAVVESCTTASDSAFNIISGTVTVHVCEYSSFGVCVTPRLPPCCESAAFEGERIASNSSQEISISGVRFTVRFYIRGVGGCYIVKNDVTGERAPICQPACAPTCTDIPSDACEDGIVEGTTCDDGVCQCKPGYTGNGCCDCLLQEGFYRPVGTQLCLPCDCCINGTAGSAITCDSTGQCNCKDGFSGDKCCTDDCECCTDNTIEDSNFCDANGQCRCVVESSDPQCCNPCDCCTPGTVGGSEECDANGQCDCAEGFFGDKCCDTCTCCPEGTVDGSNVCNDQQQCICREGYSGEGCCDNDCDCCEDNTVEGSNECDATGACNCDGGFIDDKCCNPCECCTTGTVGGSEECDANGVCQCNPGFIDDKCCDPCNCCTTGTVGGSAECDANGICECADGFFGDKCCDPCNCCEANTVGGSINCNANGQCDCEPGFGGDDCCTDECNCCVAGTVDGSNECDANGQCTCAPGFTGPKCCESSVPCGEDTDFYWLVDTTRSYRNNDLCLQTYTMMVVVSALKLGTGVDESLVGTILYPAPRPNQNTPASYLNELGDPNVDDCTETVQRLEDLQIDIFRGIFESPRRYTPIYATRGDRTLPQNSLSLLAEALDNRPLTDRRITGIVLTDGQHDHTSLSLEDARDLLPAELDLIAAGFLNPREPDRDALMDDLQIIAGTPGNVILEDSIPDLAHSIVTLLVQKGIICPDDGERILSRISQNNFNDAQRYCSCLQSIYNGVGCSTTPVKPACPAPTLAKVMHGKVKNEEVLEEEILAAVENVLKHHGH